MMVDLYMTDLGHVQVGPREVSALKTAAMIRSDRVFDASPIASKAYAKEVAVLDAIHRVAKFKAGIV